MKLFKNNEAQQAFGYAPNCILDKLELAWKRFEPYADNDYFKNFRSIIEKLCQHNEISKDDRDEACHRLQSLYWELDMGCTLLERGHALVLRSGRSAKGPDFLVNENGQKIWIECVAPSRGKKNNTVPDYEGEECFDLDGEPIKLRLLSVFYDKYKKYKDYLTNNTVEKTDACIIAINGSAIPFAFIDSKATPLRFIQCLLGLSGDMKYRYNYTARRACYTGTMNLQDKIDKNQSSSSVDCNAFMKSHCARISAVIYSNVGLCSNTKKWGDDYSILHNPFASVPLPGDMYSWMTQWRVCVTGYSCVINRTDPSRISML